MTPLQSYILSLLRCPMSTDELVHELQITQRLKLADLGDVSVGAVTKALEGLWQQDRIAVGEGQEWSIVPQVAMETRQGQLFKELQSQ